MLQIFFALFLFLVSLLWGQSREEIVLALQSNVPNTQASMMIPALQSVDPAIQEYAIDVLSRWPVSLQSKIIPEINTIYHKIYKLETRCKILQILGTSQKLCIVESQQLLLKVLQKQEDISEKREALWTLIRWHKKAEFANNMLISIYETSDSDLQSLILLIFSQTLPSYNKVCTIFPTAIVSEVDAIRCQAIFLLGVIAPKNDPAITALLYSSFSKMDDINSQNSVILFRTAEALGKLTSPNDVKAMNFLWLLRSNPDAKVRITVAEALLCASRGKNPEGLKILIREMGHSQTLIRLAAATALLPYDPQNSKAWSILLQTAQIMPKEGILAMEILAANYGLTDPMMIEFLQRQYQQTPSLRLNILCAFWQIYKAGNQPPLAYFRELLQNEREPAVRDYLQLILQYGK